MYQALQEKRLFLEQKLLCSLDPDGTDGSHWEGRLSSSALAVAVASFALAQVDSEAYGPWIQKGLDWLCRNQNPDGGWGDTPENQSNLSTTLLCWCAFTASAAQSVHASAVQKTEQWLLQRMGSLEPERIADRVIQHYGNDRTFSAPILAMAALSGRLGGESGWALVPQLPFELARLPHQLFSWVRLPVVSYALPALIAVGLVKHSRSRRRGPLHAIRSLSVSPVLELLSRIQPRTGGFLEATPLTGFVTLCLEGSGHPKHPVSLKACEFLTRSIREDGGWPIDTHLATWVTTLAIKALSDAWDKSPLSQERRAQVRSWLLGQQHVTEHPFTHAAPGGWAWTPLAGGVPDADDTPGALLALRRLGPLDEQSRRAGHMGCQWLIGLQNSDGGIPTFCRGWGRLPFDRSCPDLTAHAIRAWSEWREDLEDALRSRLDRALARGWAYLEASQRPDGAWIPLWFGNENTEKHINPVYGTSQVILGLKDARSLAGSVQESLARAGHFLTQVQNQDGGWGGGHGAPSSVEETALATEALMGFGQTHQESLQRGLQWILARVETTEFKPAPIGLYFASLWYSEEMYPWVFALSCLRHAEENLL